MTISYNWLSEYLPVTIDPERLSRILTSIGLEVESLTPYESIKGSLKGLVIGEVLECEKHPNADKLSVTKVSVGSGEPLQIVCGAPNVAKGQKVIVATLGTTIYPVGGEPLTMKVAKIRSVESHGMICAEDEIGMGTSHAGILVLPNDVKVGTPAAEYFNVYADHVYEIGLTPNRMDAMSHLGVARDVCAYLSHHDGAPVKAKSPFNNDFKIDNTSLPISVDIENKTGCQRYAGVSISGVTVKESPGWLQEKLKAIGLRPISNIVDITNFILHETGQPLHAFDADAIKGGKVIVKNLPAGTTFITLDEKERKLTADDVMICNADEPMCIGGVFGGLKSGVKESTKNIFLESAWFNPIDIRKTSFGHGLRTDAAARFEKGVDISNTVNVLKRAAMLIKELAGGEIASNIVDEYPDPKQQTEVTLNYSFLKKLSGKNYQASSVKTILESLGFSVIKEAADGLSVKVPFSKPDISLPADIVEEVLRIDGFDNVEIPSAITITPSVESNNLALYKEKVSGYLVGLGFNEILTNSITNSAFFSEETLQSTVKMLNSLSADLNVMRPSMLQTGLQSVSHNLNRRNYDLRFFEFGKTYHTSGSGRYEEQDHLCLYITGNITENSWRKKSAGSDIYYLKGVVAKLLQLTGIGMKDFVASEYEGLDNSIRLASGNKVLVELGAVSKAVLQKFDIKQAVYYADFNWENVLSLAAKNRISYTELAKQLPVQRDLAVVIDKQLNYDAVEKVVSKTKTPKLRSMQLFDIFESEKLGTGKKSMAISFTFLDEEKTLTDKEIDAMMNKIMTAMEAELNAEIRK